MWDGILGVRCQCVSVRVSSVGENRIISTVFVKIAPLNFANHYLEFEANVLELNLMLLKISASKFAHFKQHQRQQQRLSF